MIDLDKLTLAEKIRLYAEGDDKTGFPPHGFDFTREDTDKMLKVLGDSEKHQILLEIMSSIAWKEIQANKKMKRGDRIE